MARTAWLAGCLLLSAAWSAPAGAQTPASDPFAALVAPANEVRTPQTTARLIAWAPQGVAAGKPLWVGLQLRHAPGWHSYWQNPGDAGAPTVLHWRLPTGLVAGDVVWPVPSKIAVGPLANYGYEGTVLLAAPVTVQAAPAGPLEVALQANWLVCKKECLPEQGSFRLSLPPQGQPLAEDAAVFEATLATAPQPLPTARLRAAVSPQAFTVRLVAEGLPANWRGKALHLYPQTPGIITPAAAGTQGWQGSVWHMELPLHPQRGSQPAMLPVERGAGCLRSSAGTRRFAGTSTWKSRPTGAGSTWGHPLVARRWSGCFPRFCARMRTARPTSSRLWKRWAFVCPMRPFSLSR